MTDRTLIPWDDLMGDVPCIFIAQLLLRDQLAPESAEVARKIVKDEIEAIIGHITSINELFKIVGE